MASVACPRCNNEVDAAAERCPHCGHDLTSRPEPDDTPPMEDRGRTEAATHGEATAQAVDEDDGPVVSPEAAGPEPAARGFGGIQWTAILFGFATFLVGGYLLQYLFAPTIASIVSLGAGMAVAAGAARQRKFLHAALVFGVYFALSVLVTLLAGPPDGAAPGGGAGGGGAGGGAGQ